MLIDSNSNININYNINLILKMRIWRKQIMAKIDLLEGFESEVERNPDSFLIPRKLMKNVRKLNVNPTVPMLYGIIATNQYQNVTSNIETLSEQTATDTKKILKDVKQLQQLGFVIEIKEGLNTMYQVNRYVDASLFGEE